MSNDVADAYRKVMEGIDHPSLIICDAASEHGKYILANRDGETDFDGFHHAYVKRGDQTFLVPLWEWKDE